ncbi:MAG: sulfonate transport system substrate-binding protein [Sphingomonadales bacterium]|nr:sulfonate transport system substrate-binding protein [Sphingomonadales bacterium]
MTDYVKAGSGRWPTRRKLLIVVAIAVVALAIASIWRPGSASKADAARTLTVGDQRGGAQALLSAAGELKDIPYHIEWALFPAAAPLLEALGVGAIDIGGVGGSPFAFAYASGSSIKAVHAYRPIPEGGRASAIIVKSGSPLRTIADLKGRKVATIRGSAGQDLVLRLLARAGMSGADVEWIYLANGESKAALDAGSIDAWSTWGSYVGIAVIENSDRVLADATTLPRSVGFYAANDAAIAKKRALLADYIQRLTRARFWAISHQDEYAAVLARETGIPLPVARFTVASYVGNGVPIDRNVIDEQAQIFERYQRAGLIPKVPDLHGGYDPSFNDAVLATKPKTVALK